MRICARARCGARALPRVSSLGVLCACCVRGTPSAPSTTAAARPRLWVHTAPPPTPSSSVTSQACPSPSHARLSCTRGDRGAALFLSWQGRPLHCCTGTPFRLHTEHSSTPSSTKRRGPPSIMSSVTNHSPPSFYAVYLLRSCASSNSTKTYIGSSPDPARRKRQHNGELKGGAWKTRTGRPWETVAVVWGFGSKIAALQVGCSHPYRGGCT